jgi:Uma2 family endonuclease
MGMAATTYYTADMVRALPEDGKRYETVHGELLVTPAPRPLHELVRLRLQAALWRYLDREPAGQLFGPLGDISWGPDILVQPDLFVLDQGEARTLDWSRAKTLLLAVEVLIPSSVRADRFTKRRVYQEHGVGTYWVVDPDAKMVEVWTPTATMPVVERERLTWHPTGASAPFQFPLAGLFDAP